MKQFLILSCCIAILLAFSGCVAQEPVKIENVTQVPIATETTALESYVIVNESQPQVKVEVISRSAEDSKEEQMYRSGGKYLGNSWKFERKNVSGYKNLQLDVSVYRYKFLKTYWESAAPDWGTFKYWPHTAPAGQKYLFVFVRSEMEGENQNADPRIWGFDQTHFSAQYKETMASKDINRNFCVPIKEMQDIYTFNDDSRVNDYAKDRIWDSSNGWSCQDPGWLRMGTSNAWDGYIIFVVPENTVEEDIKILGGFNNFGSSWWYLHEKPR